MGVVCGGGGSPSADLGRRLAKHHPVRLRKGFALLRADLPPGMAFARVSHSVVIGQVSELGQGGGALVYFTALLISVSSYWN
jgi:hypothetical protein